MFNLIMAQTNMLTKKHDDSKKKVFNLWKDLVIKSSDYLWTTQTNDIKPTTGLEHFRQPV